MLITIRVISVRVKERIVGIIMVEADIKKNVI